MRRDVMSIIISRPKVSGWALRIERALMLGVRKRVYAFAAIAFLAIVSASVVAQIRNTSPAIAESAATFDHSGRLLRPEQYRDWIFVGSPLKPHHSSDYRDTQNGTSKSAANVYINPGAYRQYEQTGEFPEGTMMVLEVAGSEAKEGSDLLASVKDRTRFAGGWGFFEFTGNDGHVKSATQVVPDSSGCVSCHEKRGGTDHVFTQFYPILRSSLKESPLPSRRQPTTPTELI
jgi:hypothetical protein